MGAIYTVNKIIFAQCNFRPSTHANSLTCPEFAQTQLCLNKDNLRHWKSPSLQFAC